MKKDTIYSMRMNGKVREALGRAANKERRTVASLLDKIITDFLTREGYLSEADFGAERRKFHRKKLTMPTETILSASNMLSAVRIRICGYFSWIVWIMTDPFGPAQVLPASVSRL